MMVTAKRIMIIPQVGDNVHVEQSAYDTSYSDTGRVTAVRWNAARSAYLITVNGNDYLLDDSATCAPIQPRNARCRLCSETGAEMTPVEIVTWYGEDGKEDEAGSFSKSRIEWQCSDTAACRQRRREMWAVTQELDKARDAAARESGWGAIGGYHG